MKQLNIFLLIIAGFCINATVYSQDTWPKNIGSGNDGKLTVYEPEFETVSGNSLTGRAAVSIRKTSGDEPVFGAILFNSTVDDNNSGKAKITSLRVTNAKFPGVENDNEVERLTGLIEKEAVGWDLGMSLNQLTEIVQKQNAFNNAAPKIIYADRPTTLVVLDGEPRTQYDEDLKAEKVLNSPNIIFKDGGQWNLYAGGNWYKSNSITSGWKHNTRLSAKLKAVDEQIKKQEAETNKEKEIETPRVTEIIVATEPTELLQTDGEPVYKNVAGTSLLYVSNSPNEIFKDINTQKSYILLAGRWYNAQSVNGPWQHVPSDKLPEDFAKIPDGSEKSEVLSNVAGTDEATEAVLDAEIPKTAKVDRKTASIDVQYDGEPIFNRIDGTSLRLAENANVTVMLDGSGNYFALDNGIWFISDDPFGPWAVANDRPRDLDRIPASSPAYHSRYVYVYDYTPDYVITGYTSGYLGNYIYGPTIIYGTGYWYRPWFRRHYYPRPITWGFGFFYDPWYGWSANWGYNVGFLYVGFNYGRYGYPYGGGWFGPSRYCPVYYGRSYWQGGYYGRAYARRDYYGRSYGNRSVQYNNNVYVNNVYVNQRGVSPRNDYRYGRTYRANTLSRSNENLSEAGRGRYSNNRLREIDNTNSNNRQFRRSNNNTGTLERNSNIQRREQQEGNLSEVENHRYSNRLREVENRNSNDRQNDNTVDRNVELRRREITRPQESINNNNSNQNNRAPLTSPSPSFERTERRENNYRRELPSNNRPTQDFRPSNNRPEQPARPIVRERPAFSERPSVSPAPALRSNNNGGNNNSPEGRRPARR
jgi:hypothetical protein